MIEIEEITEHEDGSATFNIKGSKEDIDSLNNAMFSHFLSTAIKLVKERDMIEILDDLSDDNVVKIKYDDYDKIENKLIQAKGIVNLASEAYSASEFEDLISALWAVSNLLEDVEKILESKALTDD